HLDERGKAIIAMWGELPRLVDAVPTTRLILPWVYTAGYFAKPGAIERLMALILANPFPPDAQALYLQSQAISTCDTSDRLSELQCPTGVVVGSEDILLPVVFSQQLAQGIRGAELVVLEKTGHGLLIESPNGVATAMLDFLSRQRAECRQSAGGTDLQP